MYNTVNKIFFLLLFFIPHFLSAQILPKEGSNLNYRLIGFSFPPGKQTGNYKIEIAMGNYTVKDSFERHIIQTEVCTTNKKIIEVPSFGREYTWRVIYAGNISAENNSMQHFRTMISPDIEARNIRVRILKNAEKFKDVYVFVDGNRVLYDMAGNPVWFLNIKGLDPLQAVRDMKLSPFGTITFLQGDREYEINYNGDILWKGPNNVVAGGDDLEHYHHELTRLANGHYMTLGVEHGLCQLPGSADTGMHILGYDKTKWENNNAGYKKIDLGTVLEYDAAGNLIWSWRSSTYFFGSDIDYYRNPVPDDKYNIDVHENGFFFDEKDSIIYISFKNLNRIIKVKYPEGTVLNTYGELYKPGLLQSGGRLFCSQHSCLHAQSGALLVYNNNYCNPGSLPEIIAFREPGYGKDSLVKIWEYTCTVEGGNKDSADGLQKMYSWPFGGNVIELPDTSLFVCMGGNYSKLFILNKNKKIVWSALPEKWDLHENKWIPSPVGYRASVITDHQALEKLVWSMDIKE